MYHSDHAERLMRARVVLAHEQRDLVHTVVVRTVNANLMKVRERYVQHGDVRRRFWFIDNPMGVDTTLLRGVYRRSL